MIPRPENWISTLVKKPSGVGWYVTHDLVLNQPSVHYWEGENWDPKSERTLLFYKSPLFSQQEAQEFIKSR
jgi:hypothetical protein